MRFLIADDEPALCRLMLRVLTSRGHACSAVGEPDELERAARLHEPDAVISDIDLGRGDGIAVCLRLKQARPALKILLVTGDPEQSRRARALGLSAVLDKPFTLAEFEAAVAELEGPRPTPKGGEQTGQRSATSPSA